MLEVCLVEVHSYEKVGARITRQGNKYIFQTDVPTVGAYTHSLYYLGANLWNKLPFNIQNAKTKVLFKNDLKTFSAMN